MALFSSVFLHVPSNFIIKRHRCLSNMLPIESAPCHLCKTITISRLASQKPELWSSHWLPPHLSASPLRQPKCHAHSISPLLDSQVSQPTKHEPKKKCIHLGFRIYHVTFLPYPYPKILRQESMKSAINHEKWHNFHMFPSMCQSISSLRGKQAFQICYQ